MILSAAPVLLNYGYDNNISFNDGIVYTNDGLDFDNNGLLSNAIDVSLNNEQLLLLTNNIKLSDYIAPVSAPAPESYVYSTLITDYTGNYLYATDPTNINGSTISLTSNILSATVFNLYFPLSARTVQIYYQIPNNDIFNNLYLVCNSSLNSVSGCTINNILDPSYYTYYYNLSGDAISFISVAPGINTKWLTSHETPLVYLDFTGLSASSHNNLNVPVNNIFRATRLSNNNANNYLQAYGQSDLIKYKNITNELAVNNSTGNVPFNYLISAAFKTVSAFEPVDTNISILKNYYSPLHDQTAVLNQQLRNYTKIYTGLNEADGFNKIHLGYNANTSKITFTQDKDTYFHYPYGTTTTPLSVSTLVDYGARADITPFRSDRIYKKVADYKNYSSWGDSTNNPRKGVYFCSWLSAGNPNAATPIRPVWVDRYFNPAILSAGIPFTTILYLSGALTDSANNYPTLVYDVPSTSTFDPGVLYYYHRNGRNDNVNIVNSISGLTYLIDSWGSNLTNSVDGMTAGAIVGFTENNSVTDSTLSSPYYDVGTTYGYIDTQNSDFNTNGNTLSFFAYQKDWSNIVGDQIVGNYFNGGIGVFNNNRILTPYFTVATYNSNGGALQTYNTAFNLLQTTPYNTFNTTSNLVSAWCTPNVIVRQTYDKDYYVLDNLVNQKNLSTFDPNDLNTYKAPLTALTGFYTATSGAPFVDAYILSSGNIVTKHHPSNGTAVAATWSSTGNLISYGDTIGYNNFVVDLYGNTVWFNSNAPITSAAAVSGWDIWSGTNGCVDNNNNVFTLSGNGNSGTMANKWVLNRNNIGVLNVANPEYVNCDQDNNIWIAYNSKFLLKTDNFGNIIWNKQINTTDPVITTYSTRVINFIAVNTATGIEYYGLVIDGKSQCIYKIDTNGNVVNKLSVPGLIPGGDSTGFDYQRKYIAPKVNTPGIQVRLAVQDTTLTNNIPNYLTLNFGTSALEPGWHHFAVTYDPTNAAALYVDGKLVDQFTDLVKLEVLYSIYNYKNNPQIALGTTNFKVGFLNQWIQLPETYLFNGYIADVRLYNNTLNNSDIKAIFRGYRSNQFDDLSWVIPTGTRGYIEEIERFFLHRLPGSKSQFYDIRIKNSTITDPSVQAIVENNIRTAAINTAPAYTQLRNIVWE